MVSRFSLTTHPVRQPANDIVTGGTVGPFIDTGRELKFQDKGRVYLSVSTVKEMAEVAGLSSGISEQKLENDVRAAFQEGYAKAIEEMDSEQFDSVADRLDRILSARRAGDAPDSDVADEPVAESVAESVGDTAVEPVGDDKAPRKQGRARVSSSKSDGLSEFKL